MEPPTVTVVLADEQPVVRSGLRTILSRSRTVHVAAEAPSALESVRIAVLHRPDVLIIDIEPLGKRAEATIREIRHRTPSTAVLVFTAVDDDQAIVSALRAGARGYLLKNNSDEGVERTVHALAMGETVLGCGVADRIVKRIDDSPELLQEVFLDLTARQRNILELMVSGRRNSAIAAELHLSPKTVANHVSRIFGKLRVADRAELIQLVRRGRGDRGGGVGLDTGPGRVTTA